MSTKKKPTHQAPEAASPASTKPSSDATPGATSKSAAILALLQRSEGATLEQMMEVSGWQKHSVRGFMAGSLKKRHGLTATSEKTEVGRIYHIASSADGQ